MEKIKILDLFSGTGSVSKAAALDPDLECFSLDISCKFSQPDLLIDIHEWDYRKVSRRRFDIIAAIVPCQIIVALVRVRVRVRCRTRCAHRRTGFLPGAAEKAKKC